MALRKDVSAAWAVPGALQGLVAWPIGAHRQDAALTQAPPEPYIREGVLQEEIRQLRIEIDEATRQKQVSEIVETDFFRFRSPD